MYVHGIQFSRLGYCPPPWWHASGLQHPDTLASMSNLANVLSSQGKYEEAEEMLGRG